MKDFLGRELNIGDEVLYLNHTRTSSYLRRAIVTGFTPMKIRMNTFNNNGTQGCGELKFPYHVVKVRWRNID